MSGRVRAIPPRRSRRCCSRVSTWFLYRRSCSRLSGATNCFLPPRLPPPPVKEARRAAVFSMPVSRHRPSRRRVAPQYFPCPSPTTPVKEARRTAVFLSGTMEHVTRIVIIGGGPGGYEAALVASRLGAEVVLVEAEGVGGASVLTDCVPSKTLIATADVMSSFESAAELGIRIGGVSAGGSCVSGVNLDKVNRRVKDLASAQSVDIAEALRK